jgi:hypothetical protein
MPRVKVEHNTETEEIKAGETSQEAMLNGEGELRNARKGKPG